MSQSQVHAEAMPEPEPVPSRLRVWTLASRPHTLTASVAPVIVGHASTLQLIRRHPDLLLPPRDDATRSCAAVACDYAGDPSSAALRLSLRFAAFACLIQVATNLHNDYADFVKGADDDKRVGQARATQRGWLTPYETCRGCLLCLSGALIVGVSLLVPLGNSHSGNDLGYDPVVAFVVASSLFNAVAYTGGPFPLGYVGLGSISIGYSGLGDLFVFLYFGIVATAGAPYLFATSWAGVPRTELWRVLRPSIVRSVPIGFLATAIIVVNNLRDRHTDVRAGKRTMAVRFGGGFARMEYLVLVVWSYGFCVYFWLPEREASAVAWASLLPLLSFPLAVRQLKAVAFGGKDGQALNEHVGGTAMVQMLYCMLMTVGLMIS